MLTVVRVLAVLLTCLFLASIIGKLDSWDVWTGAVGGWIPERLPRGPFVVGIPALESLTASALVMFPGPGLFLASALLFALGTGVLLLTPRYRGKKCGCFGARVGGTIGPALGFRNLSLSATTLGVALLARGRGLSALRLPELLLAVLVGMLIALAVETKNVSRQAKPRDHGPSVTLSGGGRHE